MANQIQFNTYGDANVLEYTKYSPKDPAPDEIQVANKAIGLNYIDTYFRSGLLSSCSISLRSWHGSLWNCRENRNRCYGH